MSLAISLRQARNTDVSAITSLVLTSFRQFPLFDFLYSPLRDNIDNAHDTVFFWSRRVRAAIYDAAAMVVVAEIPSAAITAHRDEYDQESWKMLEWATKSARLSQSQDSTSMTIVGFAIWRWKCAPVSVGGQMAFLDHARTVLEMFMDLEAWVYGKFYTRKDQHPERYAAYLESEKELEERYFTEPCLNLDNLCVDFRVQRLGIGRALVEWGIARARDERFPIQTEASAQGAAFYQKLGFQHLGDWTIRTPDPSEKVRLLVMKLSAVTNG